MARWRAAKEAETGEKDRRPYLASECTELPKCEKWRLEIIREISKKVTQIQNGRYFLLVYFPMCKLFSNMFLLINFHSWSW